ncbi:translation initiation factor IF-2-like [Sorex araneus]|uniref:translation initiation factor IF-2-like n=1 Tax=Sorex araneus TaxID=42254 RepID=UPI00243409A5|nr:translation initiation factor IF-2-like [Sorex araneus]
MAAGGARGRGRTGAGRGARGALPRPQFPLSLSPPALPGSAVGSARAQTSCRRRQPHFLLLCGPPSPRSAARPRPPPSPSSPSSPSARGLPALPRPRAAALGDVLPPGPRGHRAGPPGHAPGRRHARARPEPRPRQSISDRHGQGGLESRPSSQMQEPRATGPLHKPLLEWGTWVQVKARPGPRHLSPLSAVTPGLPRKASVASLSRRDEGIRVHDTSITRVSPRHYSVP